jgi:hypothetical protein
MMGKVILSKEEFIEVISSFEEESAIAIELNNVLQKLTSENVIFSLVSDRYSSAGYILLRAALGGEANFDTVTWWMYDTKCHSTGIRKALSYDTIDGKEIEYDLSDIGALYDYLVMISA